MREHTLHRDDVEDTVPIENVEGIAHGCNAAEDAVHAGKGVSAAFLDEKNSSADDKDGHRTEAEVPKVLIDNKTVIAEKPSIAKHFQNEHHDGRLFNDGRLFFPMLQKVDEKHDHRCDDDEGKQDLFWGKELITLPDIWVGIVSRIRKIF